MAVNREVVPPVVLDHPDVDIEKEVKEDLVGDVEAARADQLTGERRRSGLLATGKVSQREVNIKRSAQERNWRLAGIVVFAVAAFLLASMGGKIVAAPITVPLMFLASRRHPTAAFRVAGVLLGGLTVAEVVWGLTYLQVEEAQPWIWLLPILGGAVAADSFTAGTSPERRGA